MNMYEITLSINAVGKNYEASEKAVIDFLNMALKEFGTENRIDGYEILEVYEEVFDEEEDDYDPVGETPQ